DAFVQAVSFDGTLALVSGSLGVDSLLWRRGVGAVPMSEYLAQQGVDLSGFADLHFFDMSYDGRTFLAEGAQNGVYVPLLITIPAPGVAALCTSVLFPLARRHRSRDVRR